MTDQKRAVEAILFAAEGPLPLRRLAEVLGVTDQEAVKASVEDLAAEYDHLGMAFGVIEVAGGYQIRTRPEYAPWLRRLRKHQLARLSRAALETLSVVAYKQPVMKSEIDLIRGVETGGVLKSLLEKDLIRILGRKDLPGRPLLYGTTRRFLDVFGEKLQRALETVGLDAQVVAGAVAVGHRLHDPVDVQAYQMQQLPGHHGDFGRVDAVGAKERTAAALGALVEVHEPFFDHVFLKLARSGQLAEDLPGQGEIAAVDGTQKFGAQHGHVLGIAAADEEMAFVRAGPATHADVHEDFEGTVFLQALPKTFHDDVAPVGRQLPIVVRGTPIPGIGEAQVFQNIRLTGIGEITRFEFRGNVHPGFLRRRVVDLDQLFRRWNLSHVSSFLHRI